MRIASAAALLCTLSLVTTARADQARRSVGKVTVTAPKGWSISAADGSLALKPTGSRDDISILVSEGSAPARNVDALLQQTWASFAGAMKISDKKPGPAAKTAAGYDLKLSTAQISSGREKGAMVVAAVMTPGAQAVVVVLMSDANLFPRHGDAIGALLDSIVLGGRAAPAAVTSVPAPAARPIDFPAAQAIPGMGKGVAGAWAVLRTGARASAASMTGVDLEARWDIFVLLPNGRYSTRLHPDGLNGKSAADLEAQWPQFWGTYRTSGKNVTLTTSNGISSTYELRGDVMVPTGRTGGSDMVRADTGPDLRISGTFARYNISERSFGNELPTIVFRKDGTFEDRFGGVYTVLQNGKEWSNASARGTYRIRNNSLYLMYEGGAKRSLAHFAVLPTGGSKSEPKGLYIHDYWVTRR